MAIINMIGNQRTREKKANKFDLLKIYNFFKTKYSVNKLLFPPCFPKVELLPISVESDPSLRAELDVA